MPLVPGRRLGPYEILEPLGAGGMGEVYRARDTRLGRDVAVKVLPDEVSADAGRLKRLENEARAASALSHPNIVTIYEIGEIDSVRFIAMERVDGKTLRELLRAGPLSPRKVLDIATQIAGGLAKAHEAGIVHRDLKPANVMLTTDGLVKILDFGLAKLTPPFAGTEGVSQPPTLSRTSPGTAVGTFAYMSPEQAAGQIVDVRSDQFSFGSILYEMATGTTPFRRATATETLAAILHDEPEPVRSSNPRLPAPLCWIIERCHAKAAAERYDSTGDLARELASLRLHLSQATSADASGEAAASSRPRRRRLRVGVTVVGLLLAGLGLGLGLATWVNAPERPRFERITHRKGVVAAARFAPGGQAVVYSASWEGKPLRVFTSNLGSADSRDLGIEGMVLDVSAAGELLVFTAKDPFGGATGDVWLASLSGAAPRALTENVRGATFSPDGSQIALIRPLAVEGLRSRLEFPMGEVLYESRNELFGVPGVAPDGSRVTVAEQSDTATDILTVDRSGRRSTIASFPRTSDLFAFRAGSSRSWIMQGDERRGTEVVELSSSGRLRTRLRVPLYVTLEDVAPDGRWLVASHRFRTEMFVLEEGAAGPRRISWFGASIVADVSSDGRTVLFTETTDDRERSVYLREIEGSPAVRLGAGGALALSPDGLWALAAPDPEAGALVLYPTGPGETRAVSAPGVKLVGGQFFPAGDRLLLIGSEAGAKRLYVLPLGGGAPQPLDAHGGLLLPEVDARVVIAPDGQSLLLETGDGWRRVAAGGAEARPLPVEGLGRGERVMQFRDDGKAVFTRRVEADTIVIEVVELQTGRRSLVRRLPLEEGAFASARLHPARITPDGKTLVYSLYSATSDLYLVEGLR